MMLTRRSLVSALGLTCAAAALPARAQAKPVTLVVANSQWLDALRGKSLWAALLKYQQVAPHVTLQQEAIPSADFNDKITTELGAGQGPDIALMQEGLFFSLADAGFLVPLDKAAEGVALNVTNEQGVFKGKRLGVAWQRAAYALIYNKKLAEAAAVAIPRDLDGLIAAARAIQDKTGAVGFSSRHQMADFSGWFMDFQNWAYGYGANWVDGQGKLTLNTPEAIAAVAAFKKVYDASIVPIGDDMPTQRMRFKQRQIGFSIDNSGGTLNIASGGPLAAGDIGGAALPFPQPGAYQQIFLGISRHSKNQNEALAFLSWLLSRDGQQALREASGPDTLATDVPLTDAFRAANPWADTFAALALKARSTLIPGYEIKTPSIMRLVMEAVEKVIVAGVAPKAALDEAQKQALARF